MRPNKMSSNILLEVPPVLTAYLQAGRNVWVEALSGKGLFRVMERDGIFLDLEGLACERNLLMRYLGIERARGLLYRIGFDHGRREALRHYEAYGKNGRLALQAGPVFSQVQGRFEAETISFEFDLDAATLHREIVLHSCAEAQAHRLVSGSSGTCACWATAGFLSGHLSEILQQRAITMELSCTARGDSECRLVSRLDHEWGEEANWVREAFSMTSFEEILRAQAPRPVMPAFPKKDPAEANLDDLVADSEAMHPVMRRARLAASTAAPVLIVGESGSGRRTLARAIHNSGPARESLYECVECSGDSEEAIERRLFGFRRGAFPGAVRNQVGALMTLGDGTIHLADASGLPHRLQGKLLRVLQEGVACPVGGTDTIPVRARIIASMGDGSQENSAAPGLRDDLYYALAVTTIAVPPLRERDLDIVGIAQALLQTYGARYGCYEAFFSEDFKQALLDCPWPGNIRQLSHAVQHALVIGGNRELTSGDLPAEVLAMRRVMASRELGESVLKAALRRTRGNRGKAADLLGVSRTTLWRQMKRLGLG